jgi:hypothetical protein
MRGSNEKPLTHISDGGHTKCAATQKCSTTAQPEQRGRLWTSWTHVYCVLQLRRKMVVVRKQPFRHSDNAVSVIKVDALPEHRGRSWTMWTHVYGALRIRRWTMCVDNHLDMTVILLDKRTTRRFNCTAVVVKRRGCDLACWCARTPNGLVLHMYSHLAQGAHCIARPYFTNQHGNLEDIPNNHCPCNRM